METEGRWVGMTEWSMTFPMESLGPIKQVNPKVLRNQRRNRRKKAKRKVK